MLVIKKALNLLDRRQQLHQILLVFIALVGSLFELIGVSAILPLMQLLMDSEAENTIFFKAVASTFHLDTKIQVISVIICFIILIFILKNLYLLFQTWYISKSSYEIQFSLTKKLMRKYMRAPYRYYTKHNTAEVQMNLTRNTVIFGLVFQYGMQLTTELIVSAVLTAFMLFANASLTVSVIFILIFGIGGYTFYTRKILKALGEESQISDKKLIQWINQAIGGIKEAIIFDRTQFFLNKVDGLCGMLKKSNTRSFVLTKSPHYITEMLCMSSVLFTILMQINLGTDINKLIAQLAAFAVAAFRLLPSIGKINGLLGSLQFSTVVIDVLSKTIYELDHIVEHNVVQKPMSCFTDKIVVKNLSFSYEDNELILDKVNLDLIKGKSTAFIGPSGAGKSTLADLLLGMISPASGDILIDGKSSIYESIYEWRKQIGYIPQTIFLIDDTIRNNIAFGMDEHSIDDQKVWNALEQAQLDHYVRTLPDGIHTIVGERGVRLSGGQRQRIGIARALYNNPEILVMDEATSALDNETEAEVMDAVNCLYGMKTMLIIAHRLSTIEHCDRIYEIKDANVIDVTHRFHT